MCYGIYNYDDKKSMNKSILLQKFFFLISLLEQNKYKM